MLKTANQFWGRYLIWGTQEKECRPQNRFDVVKFICVKKNHFVNTKPIFCMPKLILAGKSHGGRCPGARAHSSRREWQRIGATGGMASRNGTSSAVPLVRIDYPLKNHFCTSSINFEVQKLIQSTNKAPLQFLWQTFGKAEQGSALENLI